MPVLTLWISLAHPSTTIRGALPRRRQTMSRVAPLGERQSDDDGIVVRGPVGGRELRVEVNDVDLGAAGQAWAHQNVVENLGVSDLDEGVAIIERQTQEEILESRSLEGRERV